MQFFRKLIFVVITFLFTNSMAQAPYKLGDHVQDFEIVRILNQSNKPSLFSELQSKITILDFFGTWCIPCIKALPHLAEIDSRFKTKASVILISIEAEDKLAAFIKSRNDITFPLIVDKDEIINNKFQPVSYPYTVVLDANRKIIFIGNAASLSIDSIASWIKNDAASSSAKTNVFIAQEMDMTKEIPKTKEITPTAEDTLIQLSQDFAYAVKTGASATAQINQLKNLDFNFLSNTIAKDDAKKAFWINMYNGFTQFFLKQNHSEYKNRHHFFGAKQITIAGKNFSLDDIEHGILRHSKIKWSLGYLNKWFPSKIEKKLRVGQLDYRIHFALNCGAKSCPPIAFYKSTTINTQLDIATHAYLLGEVEWDSAHNKIKLPKLMSWFRHDFGGKRNMLRLIKKLQIIPENKFPIITFKPYSWALYLDHYKN